MIDKHLTALTARLRAKRFMWPKADDPSFVEKITKRQYQTPRRPTASVLKGLEMTTEEIGDYECITISPKNPKKNGRILYIHGGAFVFPITTLHWKAIADITHRSGISVVVPMYPFVPEYTYKNIHTHIKQVYDKIITTVEPPSVSVIGDSAGGNLALVLPFLVDHPSQQPGRIIALSPVVDLSADNPSMDIIEPSDPLLPLDAIRLLLPRYYAEKSAKDPIISPLFADYGNIRSKLYILNGGKDLLSPDIMLFHKTLTSEGIRHTYVFEKHLPHAWPILPLRSAPRTRAKIAEWCNE